MTKAAPIAVLDLGSSSAIPAGQGRCYVVGSEQIAVFRQRDGRIFATQNLCPHRQGPLSEGIVGDGRVICPMHAHQFDLKTGTGSETHECLSVYDVGEAEGKLILSMEGILA